MIDTAELQGQLLADWHAYYDGTLCLPPNIDPFLTALGQASDILRDGTQDPSKTCDGISIGLGFDAALVTLGAEVPPPPPPPPCPG